jgi:exosortase
VISRTAAIPLGFLLLAASGAMMLGPLARFWNENANYGYGWGVPFLAAYLVHERWRCRPAPTLGSGRGRLSLVLVIGGWALVCLALRLVLETEPASRPLLWLAASWFAGAALAWAGLLGGSSWVRHFAFPVLFLLAGVPWIFRCELLLVQGLMRWNAAWVAAALRVAGEPALAAGNTIVLSSGQLGVSEACSGIRSLQAALMMALFFGEFYRHGWRGRLGLLAAGALVALLGNFVRMLSLAWRGAVHGVAAVEAAHDSTGWLILGTTIAALWLIGLATKPARLPVRSRAPDSPPSAQRPALTWAIGVFATTLLARVATQGWYSWRESSAPHYPAWTVAWPERAPDFQSSPLPRETLRELRAADASTAAWRDAAGWRWNGLWIRYHAGAEGKVVFEAHNPTLCLPAAGWRPLPGGADFALEANGVRLNVEGRSFATAGRTAQVFWIPYLDGGMRAGADRAQGLYGHAFAALIDGRAPWLADVWTGCRGVEAETLEVAVTGPARFPDAAAAFRSLAAHLVQPDVPVAPELVAGGR